MEHMMLDLQSSLEIRIKDVRMIGIKGMGGSGKTTLARAISDKLSPHFEAKSFIENVREVSKASLSGLLLLQRQVLSDLIMDQGNYIGSVHDGKNVMKIRLRGKKVLLVLDDVDHISQLEALAGESNWFKPGSRIIITTRDEQVLIAHRVSLIRDVDLLSDEEAIRLFSRHTFGKDIPTKKFERQSLEVVRYAAGLPLTIKVLGSNLCGKDETEWTDALERLRTIPLKETLKILQLSYESLEDDHKEIFLDVACLLKDWNKDNAVRVLESCGFHAINGLRVLQQKSLITIDYENWNRIRMHHHIEEMGKYIVRYPHPDDPSKHSRLWVQEEIEDVLANDLGTEATRCIGLKITPEIVLGGLRNMKKLRCLIIDYRFYNNYSADYVKIDEVLECFPNSLRYLYWCGYPHTCLPETFRANNLVALKIHNSKIEKLWEARKVTKLRTCDLGLMPNLERLHLTECVDLAEVRVPVGGLKTLVDLNMSNCKSMKSLSFIKQLESLEVLEILKLEHREFPDIIPHHSNSGLLQLKIVDSDIEEVATSIGNFRKLVYLNLNGSKHLKSLPISFYSLQHLRTLTLQHSGIEELLEGLGQLEYLDMLDLRYTNIKQLPDSICTLKNLKTLLLHGCKLLEKCPQDLCQLESLEVLDLSWCKIRDIPSSICRSKHLKTLLLKGCDVLDKLPEYLGQLESLEELVLKRCYDIREIPSSICTLKHLKILDLEFCHELKNLPEELGDIESLRELNVRWTNIRRLPHKISLLKDLNIVGFGEEVDVGLNSRL
ncbi:putative P-loop containing nucleoside triphosphate hydrolase, leucine-rich repeat domain superfamily [Helianthus anomalus]